MPDLLHDLRSSVEKRLRELEPFVKEHADLRRALDALGRQTAPVRRAAARRSPVRRGTTTAARTRGRRGRPAGSGARAQEALKLVRAHPGITIGELAKRMKIKPNYLYRVLPGLEKAGHVKKRDKGYHPEDGSSET